MKQRSSSITFRGRAARQAFESITGTKIKSAAKVVQFKTTDQDRETIAKIAKRAVEWAQQAGVPCDLLETEMDITATHCNGCPLDLSKLLAAPDSDFGHDVWGIRRHINRRTGELEDLFSPRCALPETKKDAS